LSAAGGFFGRSLTRIGSGMVTNRPRGGW